jgi:DNA-directed RNA polymerase specialized sigma24 family protein
MTRAGRPVGNSGMPRQPRRSVRRSSGRQLRPLDRQVMLLYLEQLDAASIAEITGLSAANVATKVRRIKQLLIQRFHEGKSNGE